MLYCSYLRDLINSDARKRINAIQQYTALGSGFKIAMRDLEIRGAGNLLGTKQSGHIAAVGFDLYCQLLRQSIDQLSTGRSSTRVDVTLRADFLSFNELDLDQGGDTKETLRAYLPANYMPEARLRISAYKELAELISLKELKALRARWQDRFGKAPRPVLNLLLATELKLTAAKANISSVEIREQRLMLTRNGNYIFLTGKRFPRLDATNPLGKSKKHSICCNLFKLQQSPQIYSSQPTNLQLTRTQIASYLALTQVRLSYEL